MAKQTIDSNEQNKPETPRNKYEDVDYVRSLVGKVQARRGFSAKKNLKLKDLGSKEAP